MTEPANREWRRRAAGWAFYGALSGAAASAGVSWIERLRIDALMDPGFYIAPGLIFGLAVAWKLYRGGHAPPWRALFFVAISTAAWPVAYYAGLAVLVGIETPMPDIVRYTLFGLAGGLAWSAMLTAAATALFIFARARWLALLATGGLAGAVLAAPLDIWGRLGGSMVIYVILWGGWLAAWAAVFSTALPVADADD